MDKVNIVPGFILKLWKMINDPQCDDLIAWSDKGESFIILDPPKFSQQLSKYFKHNNLSSFIRQLNMYGFRKVATIENCGLQPSSDDLHFYHPDFVRDKPDRLEAIKRKLPQKLTESIDLRNVVKDISDIEDKQKNVSRTLQDLKRENELLWAQLAELRQKHQQQQMYINSLMKLIYEAMEQKHSFKSNILQLKRNSPLMIGNVEQVQDINQVPLIQPTSSTQMIQDDNSMNFIPATIQTATPAVISAQHDQPMQHMDAAQMQIVTNPSGDQIQNIADHIDNQGDQIDQLIPAMFEDFNDEEDMNLFSN